MAKAKNVDIVELFKMMSKRNEKIKALKAEIQALEKETDLMEQQLYVAIPANTVKNGLQHIVTTRSSVSYQKALNEVTEKLVPKTKAAEVNAIIESFTSVSEIHKIKAV